MAFIADNLIFATYFASMSAICINLVRAKLQDDYHEEIQKLREYDLSTDHIHPELLEKNPGGKFIILAN
jgi:hypothetical protein